MKFCPNCNNNCIITRLTAAQQAQKLVMEESDSTSSDMPSSNNATATKVDKNDKNKTEGLAKAFFKCTNCDYLEAIEEGTLILSRTHNNLSTEYHDTKKYNEMINDSTLPHTRNYICPNKSCKSHNNHEERDAVMFKPSQNTYNTKMICTSCKTLW
jgi:hypothetical protein